MIDISKFSKASVLAALYNASHPQGMGFMHFDPADMEESEAQRLFDDSKDKYFDYVKGRILKVDLSGEELDPRLYDRDNGNGAAWAVISRLSE